MNHDKLSMKLWRDITGSEYRAQAEKIMDKYSGDIGPGFLAFVGVYKGLSLSIGEDYTVYDFGCAYNFQNWYFRRHKKYIAINPGDSDMMVFGNTEVVRSTIQEYLPIKVDKKSFAICSAVPAFEHYHLIKESFNNMFIWYPS